MYGLILNVVESLVVEQLGEKKLQEIKEEAGFADVSFLAHQSYEEELLPRFVTAAANVTGLAAEELLELAGTHFFEYCQKKGHDRMMTSLGHDLPTFLTNLDALHDHLSYTFPSMMAPSFRCDTKDDDATLILHYYSTRQGMESLVIGIVKAVAKEMLNIPISMKVLSCESLDSSDAHSMQYHVVMAIEQVLPKPNLPELREDASCEELIHKPKKVSWVSRGLSKKRHISILHDDVRIKSPLPERSPLPSPCLSWPVTKSVFAKHFPFHAIFTTDMVIVSVGKSLKRLLPSLTVQHSRITDYFAITRPQVPFESCAIKAFINSKFTLTIRNHPNPQIRQLSFKGEKVLLDDANQILFLGSPKVHGMEEMLQRGLFLSDYPLHDSARDLVMINNELKVEKEIALELEQTKQVLEVEKLKVIKEKMRADNLLHAMLPISVAEELQQGLTPTALDHHKVTILFSDIKGFTEICNSCKPIQVVHMLNSLYILFDGLTLKHNVYKVETIGDAYMVAAGLLDTAKDHANAVVHMGFDMRSAAKEVLSPKDAKPLQIRLGIHSGPVVSGVVGHKMPRYCLFGDTVNTASRMESNSLPGKVHISQGTYEEVKGCDSYNFICRGLQSIKGLGYMVTYFVEPQGYDAVCSVEGMASSTADRVLPAGQVSDKQHAEYQSTTKKSASKVCILL